MKNGKSTLPIFRRDKVLSGKVVGVYPVMTSGEKILFVASPKIADSIILFFQSPPYSITLIGDVPKLFNTDLKTELVMRWVEYKVYDGKENLKKLLEVMENSKKIH